MCSSAPLARLYLLPCECAAAISLCGRRRRIASSSHRCRRWMAPSLIPTRRTFCDIWREDQKDIWTSPFHLKPADAKWLVPMSGIATGLFVTDPQSSYAMRLDNLHLLKVASDAGVASAAGMTGAMYLWGHLTHNERARETGVLATEAMINAIGVDYAMKFAFGRERPFPVELPKYLLSWGDLISVGPLRGDLGIRCGGRAGVSPSRG